MRLISRILNYRLNPGGKVDVKVDIAETPTYEDLWSYLPASLPKQLTFDDLSIKKLMVADDFCELTFAFTAMDDAQILATSHLKRYENGYLYLRGEVYTIPLDDNNYVISDWSDYFKLDEDPEEQKAFLWCRIKLGGLIEQALCWSGLENDDEELEMNFDELLAKCESELVDIEFL